MKSDAKYRFRVTGLSRVACQLTGLLIVGHIVFLPAALGEKVKVSNGTPKASNGSDIRLFDNNSTDLTTAEVDRLPLPSQKMLDEILVGIESVRVIDCGMDTGGNPISGGINEALNKPFTGKVIFESSDPEILKELTHYLRTKESNYSPGAWHIASPTIELKLANGKTISLALSGECLRWKAWRYDAFLSNASGLIQWLAEHGITDPLREQQEQLMYEKLDDKRYKESLSEFLNSMPESLKNFFGNMQGSSGDLSDLSKNYRSIPKEMRMRFARRALSRQFPEESEQIRALLEWDGNLTSIWAVFQAFPTELLHDYEPSKVLRVISKTSLSPAQWVGVIRFYSSSEFREKFPAGYKPLNEKLRSRIIREVKATGKNESDIENFEKAMRKWLQ